MSRYKERLLATGNSQRERVKFNFIKSVNTQGKNSLSLINVLIDGFEQSIFINSGTKPYYKKIESLPSENFHAGQIVKWNDTSWLIENADFDNELYVDGNMTQCNVNLKWQNSNGEIIERQCVKVNASAYNSGTEGDKVIELGYDQALIKIPFDSETKMLKRGKRFFIDNDKDNPTVYRLTRHDNTSNVYNQYGFISMILTEDQFNPETDDIEHWLCNYDPAFDNSFINNAFETKIESIRDYIKVGTKGTSFKCVFKSGETTKSDVTPKWDIVCDFVDKIVVSLKNDEISLRVDDESLIDRYFRLVLSDKDGIYPQASMLIKIIGVL